MKFIHETYFDRTDVFEEFFLHLLPQTTYSTRNNTINLPIVHTDAEKRFTIYQCCHLIREINPNFLEPQSLITLKNNLKLHLLSMY